MASKFAKQYQIPPEFPDILKAFTREVLRSQPGDINEFAAKYFDSLANGMSAPTAQVHQTQASDLVLPMDAIEGLVRDLFTKYDADSSGYLDTLEFKKLLQDLQKRLDFTQEDLRRFLAEADVNTEGNIDYEDFIPIALQIIQGIYAKKQLEETIQDADQRAEDMLVHGMSREELTDLIASLFERMDVSGSGYLSKEDFVSVLTSMDVALTRREINTVMFEIEEDKDGRVSYGKFVPFAFDLLQKLTAARMLELEFETDELAQYLVDLFKGKDPELTGALSVEDIRDLLHSAMLGLTRMQIYSIISEADVTPDGKTMYAAFIPRAVGLIRSMLSFEKALAVDSHGVNAEAESNFFFQIDEVLPAGLETISLGECIQLFEQCNGLSAQEAQATKHFLKSLGDPVSTEDAKTQVWTLIKNMRRYRS